MDENQNLNDLVIVSFKKENEKSYNHSLNRNYGLDLLKIFAMINIINLHINNSFLNLRVKKNNDKYKKIILLEAFSFWPVDAFGLISGIIGYKKCKFSNVIYIYLEYFYYSIIISLYFYNKLLLDSKNLFLSLYPLGIYRFWFVNAYILMYLFLPFITKSINSIDKNLFSKLIIAYLFIYSIYHILIEYNIGKTNFDFINRGYSSTWLLILFIIGAYIGIYYKNRRFFSNIIFYFLIYILFSFITYMHAIYNIQKNYQPNNLLMEYYSPTIMIQAFSLIFFFKNLQIKNKYLIKIILFLNPLNFNVSLIHLRIFRSNLKINNKLFIYIKKLNHDYLFFKIYGISFIIYFICAFADYLRHLLFKLLKIRPLCIYIETKLFK